MISGRHKKPKLSTINSEEQNEKNEISLQHSDNHIHAPGLKCPKWED